MIFVDTSAWVLAIRRPTSPEAATLRSLLDADEVNLALPVRLELLAGAAKKDRPSLRRALSGLPLSVPNEQTWRIVDEWVARAADAGFRFGLADLLIAALAQEHGGLVWSIHRDFEPMEKLGLIQRY